MGRFLCVLAVFLFAGGMPCEAQRPPGCRQSPPWAQIHFGLQQCLHPLPKFALVKSIRIFIAALVGHAIPLSEFKRTS